MGENNNLQTGSIQENQPKRKKKLVFSVILALLLSLGGYLAYGALINQYYTFPENTAGGKINLGLFASGPNNALDYYPGGYGVYVRYNNDLKARELTKFEIKNPALHNEEIYSNGVACTGNNTPSGCWSIYYHFSWKDASGSTITSQFPVYDMDSDYVDVIDLIKANAFNVTKRVSGIVGNITVSNTDSKILVKVRFGDDVKSFGSKGVSKYKDISKKFSFRVDKGEVRYIGVSSSDMVLFGNDGKVAASNMSKLNFASVHLAANAPSIFTYKARIEPGRNSVNIITVDMDNVRIDPTSNPQLYSYLDVYLMEEKDGEYFKIDLNGEYTNQPIARISPDKDGYAPKSIPATNTAWTNYLRGPSGTFLCPNASIGSPGFQQCYDQMEADGKMGISQHRISFPASDKVRALLIEVNNASTSVGNAFAIASDVDMFSQDIPEDEIISEEENVDIGGNTSTGNTVDGLKAITSVEINPEDGLDFGDNGKETKLKYIHTYKTELCNVSTGILNNVMTKLHLPDKTTLVGVDTPSDVNSSSLMLSGSNLDTPVDNTKKLPIGVFSTDISIGDLNVDECKFLTYQAKISSGALNGDEFIVKNEFKYGSGAYSFTNEVKNTLTLTEDISIGLESNPVSGSDVHNNDMIEYNVTIKNEGDTDIGPGKVTCPRMLDTTETSCKIGECRNEYLFDGILAGEIISYNYIVEVKGSNIVPAGTVIKEQCTLNEIKPSNEVEHNVITDSNTVSGGQFTLLLETRPKLLNTPDGNPRPDGYDRSPIKYTYRYTGSNASPMYPDQSNPGSYLLSRGRCGPMTLPYTPNSYSYNSNSSSTSPKSYLNLGSDNLNFYLNTTLPNNIPKTTLYNGTLTPSHYIPGSELNSRYKNGGTKTLPTYSTEHRALVNGTAGKVESVINGTMKLDKRQYRSYSTAQCSYDCRCTAEGGCDTCYRSYPLYRWEIVETRDVPFTDTDDKNVTVGGSVAWIKTEGSHVHTNNKFTGNGSDSNTYDLGETGYNSVSSAPKLYSPVGSYHGDYVVSSNDSSSNLKSAKSRYVYDKNVKMGHGYVYDRDGNPRDFYQDLLESQKFGKVVQTGLPNPIRNFNMDLNTIYYYPGDLTINNPTGTSIISGFKGTIVVGGNLYIKSDIKYSQEVKDRVKDLVYLGLIVKGDVYIDPRVQETSGTWFIEGTLHTGEAVETLRHLGSWTARHFDFQRKAPEFYERDVNEPSERIVFNDQVYITTPPGFAQLDDGMWSYNFNINQFTGEQVER